MENSKKIFDNLKRDIRKGVPYNILHQKYPLMTKALYKRLSGINKIYRYDLQDHTIGLLTSDGLSIGSDAEDLPEKAKDLIVGTLFGDGHIEPIVENKHTNSYLYKVTHCWSQISYIKLIYEFLKPYSSAISIKKPTRGLQDYHLQLTTITSKKLKYYRDVFYSYSEAHKKDIMSEEAYSLLNWRSLAYWIMDDGKNRGGKYCFSISIGFQDHYTDERLEGLAAFMRNRFGMDFRWKKECTYFELYVLSKDRERVKSNLLPYILPEFYYKLKVDPSEMGSSYKSEPWFATWQDKKIKIDHPYLKEITYNEYRHSDNQFLRRRYEKSLFSQTVARGFPYVRLGRGELLRSWQNISMYRVKCSEDNTLTCSPKVNFFSNHFMNHRFHCKKRNNNSPYSIYLDRRRLRKVLQVQLKSGPNVHSTNIRNALCTYSSSALGVFNTGIARYLIDKYSANDKVLDPCAGWGNRLSATVSLGKSYTGIEPSSKTYRALLEIKTTLEDMGVPIKVDLKNSVAEDSNNYSKGVYGCCITSPPYFNLEEYSQEGNQSYMRYQRYDDWCDNFLTRVISNVYESLCRGGYFIINVGNVGGIDLVRSTEEVCCKAGFMLVERYYLRPFKRPGMDKSWSEPVLVYEKR